MDRHQENVSHAGPGFVKPGADVICRRLGDAAVLIHLGTNEIFELNATGSRIWQMIAEGTDRTTMRQRLVEEFNVEERQLDREIDALIAELEARGLIVGS